MFSYEDNISQLKQFCLMAAIGGIMFDWVKFIVLAKMLFKRLDEESIRTSISRFYYGVFGVVRRYLIRVEHKYYLARRDGNIHKKVSDEIKNSDNSTLKEISKIFHKLRVARNRADYDSEYDVVYFTKFLEDNERSLIIAFDALNYLKSHSDY